MKVLQILLLGLLAGLALLLGCSGGTPESGPHLRLATTTSTENSGLLEAIAPNFTESFGISVDVIAVGTGQAIKMGETGDADVILVHARSREEKFLEAGHGTQRWDVMYNDFVIVGPKDDPAGIGETTLAAEAFKRIRDGQHRFASRGDDSGTHTREREVWKSAGVAEEPTGDWYASLGQGMGSTLVYSDEKDCYTLSDRGTFLAMKEKLPHLAVLFGGASLDQNPDKALHNPYGVIPVNPEKGDIQAAAAVKFVEWLTSIETQKKIAEFGKAEHGQPLFYPDSEIWRAKGNR